MKYQLDHMRQVYPESYMLPQTGWNVECIRASLPSRIIWEGISYTL